MKNLRSINSVFLLLFLIIIITVGCQPNEVGKPENALEGNRPVTPLLEQETATEPAVTAEVTPLPTSTTMVMLTDMPTPTQIPTEELHIFSEPAGSLVFIASENLNGHTPVTWTMLPGTYTVTFTLDGYQDWTMPITVTAGSQKTLTATLRQHHTIIPIERVTGVWEVEWADDGQWLTYSVNDVQWPPHVQFLPTYQSWWHYDVVSSTKQALPSPQTRIPNTVREMLGICPFPLPEPLPYSCSPNLRESPTSDRIVFQSEKLDSSVYTWLASIDGSDIIPLDFSESPQDVIWSSNGEWLLIGHYWGVDGSSLYHLVSADGTVIENLEKLTNTSHYRVQGPKPKFSPHGQKLAFVGTEVVCSQLPCQQLDQEEHYHLYILDLNTLEYEVVSSRFGLFQWTRDGSGLYILDGSANTAGRAIDYVLGGEVHYAELYYINLTQERYPEQKLASDIPLSLPYSGAWAYSPEVNAMAGAFDVNGTVFAILFLD